jgi:hypothetical protein
MEVEGALVKLDGHVILAADLVLISLFQKLPGGLKVFATHHQKPVVIDS